MQLEAALLGNRTLALLDLGVVELLDPAALQADQVIVVTALAQFEHRLARLEVLASEQAGMLELSEDAVDGRQPDVDSFRDQLAIHVFRREMADLARLEQLEDLAARKRRLETALLEALRRAHRAIIAAFVFARFQFTCDAYSAC